MRASHVLCVMQRSLIYRYVAKYAYAAGTEHVYWVHSSEIVHTEYWNALAGSAYCASTCLNRSFYQPMTYETHVHA